MMMWAAAVLLTGTVNGVQVNSPSIALGNEVTVTVVGVNPCGAANIDYGDGTAITYAISELPTSQSHKYEKAGTFTIIARGMGNCDGQATTKVEVKGPPPAPAPPPSAQPTAVITNVTFDPTPASVRQPVSINVAGRGTCAFVVDYGDGNQQDFNSALPRRVSHTYAVPDTYTVIVGPVAPCAGKFTQKLEVLPRGGARITGLRINPATGEARRPVTFTIEGVGTCSYTIDFGDGNGEDRSKPLADRVSHVYPAPGSYDITVLAGDGCRGAVHRALTVQ